MPVKFNRLVIGDTVYDITPAYREGARAFRNGIPANLCPYRSGSQKAWDWSSGHDNEACNEHIRFGIDLIHAPVSGREFGEDPTLTRNEWGEAILRKSTSSALEKIEWGEVACPELD